MDVISTIILPEKCPEKFTFFSKKIDSNEENNGLKSDEPEKIHRLLNSVLLFRINSKLRSSR